MSKKNNQLVLAGAMWLMFMILVSLAIMFAHISLVLKLVEGAGGALFLSLMYGAADSHE